VQQKGRGLAGFFEQFNDTTSATTLHARIRTNKPPGAGLAPVAVYGESTGIGGLGGAFWNLNPANTLAALYATTQGIGLAFSAETSTGWVSILSKQHRNSGWAGVFENTHASNTEAALRVVHYGAGGGVGAESHGIGAAVHGENVSTGNGAAGHFKISQATNSYAALSAETVGTGSAIYGVTTGTNSGGFFQINNASNNFASLNAITNGLGAGVRGETSTGYAAVHGHAMGGSAAGVKGEVDAGTGPAVFGENNSTSSSNAAYFLTSEATNSAPTVNVMNFGASAAGYFATNNVGNSAAALYAITNGAGSALYLNQSSLGMAMYVQNGGIKLSVVEYDTPGSITAKAGIYNLITSGTYTLDTSRDDGETLIITTEVGGITVELGGGWQVDFGDTETKTLVFVNGLWRVPGAYQP
jgi:hypothetical protein